MSLKNKIELVVFKRQQSFMQNRTSLQCILVHEAIVGVETEICCFTIAADVWCQYDADAKRQLHRNNLTDQHKHLTRILDFWDLPAIAGKTFVASHICARLLVCRKKKNVTPRSKCAQKCKADSVFFLYVNVIDDVLRICSFYSEPFLCFTLEGLQHIALFYKDMEPCRYET